MSTQPRGVWELSGWEGGTSCSGERARLAREDESGTICGQQARACMTHSDPQICHKNPPLFPSPETETVQCCAIQGQREGGVF